MKINTLGIWANVKVRDLDGRYSDFHTWAWRAACNGISRRSNRCSEKRSAWQGMEPRQLHGIVQGYSEKVGTGRRNGGDSDIRGGAR
jgi:hypothetical protein